MKKVVVIDDEPFILMMIEDKLQKAGIKVTTLRQSINAMSVVKSEKPDLVILDWMMPELSGIDLCKLLKADPETENIPIFMLTAKGQESDEQIGFMTGVIRYITKPFSPKALLSMIDETIGK